MTKSAKKTNALSRYAKYVLLKLDKINATPYAVAAGFACGAAISFTPFVGFHTVLALVTAFLVRGSLVSAAVGTLVGNPWTFPLIWPATLYTGRLILGSDHDGAVDFWTLFKNLMSAVRNFDFELFVSDIWPIFKPMMIGCVPYYVAAWVISYYLIKRAMDKFQIRRENLRKKQ